ncbi:MAG: EthD domain-containing protein [Chloroflexi bacterium]|nr:EthD domain-containing protein [Chloroflexota bacterium]
MIKFTIISRHKPDGTRAKFFYEWAFIHVALMMVTPCVTRDFKRYVQHYGNPDIPDEYRVLPKPTMNWESFADHWLDSFEVLARNLVSADYREYMQPHSFGDSAMEVALSQGEVAYEREGFRSGGVKLIHRLQNKPGQPMDEFGKRWRDEHAPMVIETLKDRGLRKYVLNFPLKLEPSVFKGTLFESGGIDMEQGIEELWFDSLEDATRVGSDSDVGNVIRASFAKFADIETSYSMFVHERVVFDFCTPGEMTPLPAVANPNSLEASLFNRFRPFHEPRPESK